MGCAAAATGPATHPGSPVIRELAEPAPGCRTRFIAFFSDIDHLVVPGRNARIDHPDLQCAEHRRAGVGHLSMPNNRTDCLHDRAGAVRTRSSGSILARP